MIRVEQLIKIMSPSFNRTILCQSLLSIIINLFSQIFTTLFYIIYDSASISFSLSHMSSFGEEPSRAQVLQKGGLGFTLSSFILLQKEQ